MKCYPPSPGAAPQDLKSNLLHYRPSSNPDQVWNLSIISTILLVSSTNYPDPNLPFPSNISRIHPHLIPIPTSTHQHHPCLDLLMLYLYYPHPLVSALSPSHPHPHPYLCPCPLHPLLPLTCHHVMSYRHVILSCHYVCVILSYTYVILSRVNLSWHLVITNSFSLWIHICNIIYICECWTSAEYL